MEETLKPVLGSGKLRRTLVLLLGGAAYALLYAFCSQIDESGVSRVDEALRRFCVAFPVAVLALLLLLRVVLPRMELGRDDAHSGKPFCTWGAALLIFCCYVPLFIIVYPGTFSYDSMRQVQQIASGQYSQILPLLHTLLIRLCISFYDAFGSMEKCGALYSLPQMAVMAGCFAQICASLSRSVSRRAARIAAVFFAVYPSHMAFASNCTKDGLFSAFLTLFLALCFEERYTGQLTRGRRVLRLVSGVLACLLRSNLIMAMGLWLLALVPSIRRGGWPLIRRIAAVMVLAWACNAMLAGMTHASGGSIREMLSVPLVQMTRARLYAQERITTEQKELMDSLFTVPGEEIEAFYATYDPTVSDSIKACLDEDALKARWPEYLSLWFSIGRQCPDEYRDAFLNLALPALYPYRTFHVTHRYIETGCGNSLTAPFGLPPISLPERCQPIWRWLDEHLFGRGADDVPIVRWLFNCGLVFWVMGAAVLYACCIGDRRSVQLMLLLVFYWVTHLLGPVMQGRYLYPFICALPLFLLRPRCKVKNE